MGLPRGHLRHGGRRTRRGDRRRGLSRLLRKARRARGPRPRTARRGAGAARSDLPPARRPARCARRRRARAPGRAVRALRQGRSHPARRPIRRRWGHRRPARLLHPGPHRVPGRHVSDRGPGGATHPWGRLPRPPPVCALPRVAVSGERLQLPGLGSAGEAGTGRPGGHPHRHQARDADGVSDRAPGSHPHPGRRSSPGNTPDDRRFRALRAGPPRRAGRRLVHGLGRHRRSAPDTPEPGLALSPRQRRQSATRHRRASGWGRW